MWDSDGHCRDGDGDQYTLFFLFGNSFHCVATLCFVTFLRLPECVDGRPFPPSRFGTETAPLLSCLIRKFKLGYDFK